jgi:septal ring factor EnvC (AmiA/AmiB activator)
MKHHRTRKFPKKNHRGAGIFLKTPQAIQKAHIIENIKNKNEEILKKLNNKKTKLEDE